MDYGNSQAFCRHNVKQLKLKIVIPKFFFFSTFFFNWDIFNYTYLEKQIRYITNDYELLQLFDADDSEFEGDSEAIDDEDLYPEATEGKFEFGTSPGRKIIQKHRRRESMYQVTTIRTLT